MANEEKVFVKSMTSGRTVINLPQLRFNREWPRRGVRLPIPKDILREGFYEPGVEYMFRKGMLYIEDLEFAKELGIENYDAEVPTAVIPLEDKLLDRMATKMPIAELRAELKKFSNEQLREVAEYMIKHSAEISMDRVRLISEASGVNIEKRIQMEQADKETVVGEE